MRRPAALAALGLLLPALLAGCGGSASGDGGSFAGSKVDPPFTVAPITLTDTAGDSYELADGGGTGAKLTLAFFGYTHCPDVCGLVMGNLAAAMTRLSESDREQVQVVFVTTDPARDDEQVLRRYLDRLDPDFEGLTGDLDDIAALGKSVAVGVTDGQKLPSGGYDLNTHSTQVTGIEDGEAPVFWSQSTSAAQFAADIHTVLTQGVP
ncbi:hypothetical protein GCM10022215_01430 [Nocardioides fonticola]|uniref:Protein SCO1/2 n=1 Tax=Nocardioides fonticola TaxID=450363 RepID=A0ABP7X975_9ACTN